MKEINEKDLEKVSGGFSDSELSRLQDIIGEIAGLAEDAFSIKSPDPNAQDMYLAQLIETLNMHLDLEELDAALNCFNGVVSYVNGKHPEISDRVNILYQEFISKF
ncbi:MAG: bacteriocin [Clostridia bacterium]|nr:bacteriocin [Clostridia bacterium]